MVRFGKFLKKQLMKLIQIFFITICLGSAVAKVYAQQINLREVNAPFETVYKDIQKQTDYHFAGTTELLNKAQAVSVNLVNTPLSEALAQIFSDQPLSYTIYNKMVIIKDKEIPGIKEKVSQVDVVVQQTYSISGTVNDEKGEPLPGVTVFLSNTKSAAATDGDGKFSLGGLQPGPYELNVKMLGFDADIQVIKIIDKPVNITVKLNANSIILKTVTINSKPDPKREKYMKMFIKNFIGQSVNSAQCKILNPEVLYFHYNSTNSILTAYADDLLIIENDGLGYQLKYLLKHFEFYVDHNVCNYEGNPYFEELKGTDLQQKQWEDNRKEAYLGSSRHFFRAVINNTLDADGFAIFHYVYNKSERQYNMLRYKQYDSLFVTTDNNVKALIAQPAMIATFNYNYKNKVRAQLYIAYTGAKQADLFSKTGFPLVTPLRLPLKQPYQLSEIHAFADTIKIDKELLLNPTKDFSFFGYWSWGRIAEFTPLEYFVDPLEKK